jgi:ABC-type transporter Mla subunit MlaD
MSRQAIVGLFTIVGLLALFGVALVLANIGTGGRYLTAVHFKSAAGLHKGALVYESGVIVGVVDQTRLSPEDFTVDVILAINNAVDIPRDSRFLIAAPLTGDTTLEIVPPLPPPPPPGVIGAAPPVPTLALLPREILPIEQQPQGINPATIGDLLQEGQGEVHRLDLMLSQLEAAEPKLLSSLQSALNNANDLTSEGSKRLYRLADRLDALTQGLQVSMAAGSKNLVDMTAQLDSTVRRNGGNVDTMLSTLAQTSVALNQTVDQVRDLAANPQIRQNLLDVTKGLAQTATTIAAITTDFRAVTSNPQTQAQLRDTIANTDAATQKLNSLLRSFGATSSVYGVDAGATPAPAAPIPAVPAPAAPQPSGSPRAAARSVQAMGGGLSAIAHSLIAFQIRLSELDRQAAGTSGQPLLATPRRGPQTDANMVLLPHGATSLFAGANDIGTPQTSWNFALTQAVAPHLRLGGGVLYSNLGGLARYEQGPVGFEARVYDLQFPTLDAYGDVNVGHGVQLFGGERDVTHTGRRTVFGLQLQF